MRGSLTYSRAKSDRIAATFPPRAFSRKQLEQLLLGRRPKALNLLARHRPGDQLTHEPDARHARSAATASSCVDMRSVSRTVTLATAATPNSPPARQTPPKRQPTPDLSFLHTKPLGGLRLRQSCGVALPHSAGLSAPIRLSKRRPG